MGKDRSGKKQSSFSSSDGEEEDTFAFDSGGTNNTVNIPLNNNLHQNHSGATMMDFSEEDELAKPQSNYGSYQHSQSVTHIRGKHTFTELEKVKMSNFESLDFPVIDNQIYRDFHKKSTRFSHIMRTFGKWAICFSIGVMCGILAYLVKTSVEFVQEFKFHSSEKYIQHNERAIGFIVYFSINLLFALLASLVIIPVGQIASGSGIPEVKGYLNGIRIPHSMNVRTLIGKTISLIFAYSSGLILGPEGPMIHIGSMIGGAIGQVKSKTLRWYPKVFWRYHNDRDRRDFISTGAAAGVAAAFGAPIGGVLFGFEEASSFWSRQLTWRTFFACLIATFTTNVILQGFQVQMHDIGVLTFGFSKDYLYRYTELIGFAGLGVLGGLLGAFFVYLNVRLSKWRSVFFANKSVYLRVFEVFVYITLTSTLLFSAAAFTPCRETANVIQPNFNDSKPENITYIKFFCAENEYNDMAGLSFNTLDASLRLLYSRSSNLFSITTLSVFTLLSFVLTTVTSGLMISSGLFIPMMFIGASLGRLVGQLGALIFSHANPPIDPSIYAMPPHSMIRFGITDVMKTEVVTLHEVEKVSTIIQILQSNQHNGFPVIEKPAPQSPNSEGIEDGIYCGLILRNQLMILLYYKIFSPEQPLPPSTAYRRGKAQRRWGKATDYGHIPADPRMNFQTMTQSLARHFPPIDEMNISREDMDNIYES
eukprot:gene4082-4755_t